MLSHNTRPAAVDPEAGRLQIKAAIKDRNFSAAMALQAQLRGINTSLWPTALGLKTTAELAQGDPRRNWHAFDPNNPEVIASADGYTLRKFCSSAGYVALREDIDDPLNPSPRQTAEAAEEALTAAEDEVLTRWVGRIGTATIHQRPGLHGNMVSDMQVYLPNGDIAFGGATPANVAALEAANYRVTVVDDMGKATGAVPFPPAAGNS